MIDLKNVLIISIGFPTRQNPAHCPFIGYRVAYLKQAGVKADILKLTKLNFASRTSFLGISKFFAACIFPYMSFDTYTFQGVKYLIFNIQYTDFSRYLLPLIIRCLSWANKYSLMHFHFLWSTGELSFLKRWVKLPVVVTIHGSDLHKTAVEDISSRTRFRKELHSADGVIFVSNSLMRKARILNFPVVKATVIPNGFDNKIFTLDGSQKTGVVFGFVGHLYEVKRADKIPYIFSLIKERIPQARFVILGGGEPDYTLKDLIIKRIKTYGLEFETMLIDEVEPACVPEHMKKMSVLLLPSRNEGFPTVAIEAQACGVVVVGSSNGGIPEAVSRLGSIVEEGENFEARFAEKAVEIAQKINSPKAVAESVQHLTWKHIVKQEIEIYISVIKQHRIKNIEERK